MYVEANGQVDIICTLRVYLLTYWQIKQANLLMQLIFICMPVSHISLCVCSYYLCTLGRYYNCLSLPSVYTVHRAHLSQPSSIVLPNTHKRCLDLLVRHFAGHRRHGVSWIEYIWRVGVRCLLPWYKLQTARC